MRKGLCWVWRTCPRPQELSPGAWLVSVCCLPTRHATGLRQSLSARWWLFTGGLCLGLGWVLWVFAGISGHVEREALEILLQSHGREPHPPHPTWGLPFAGPPSPASQLRGSQRPHSSSSGPTLWWSGLRGWFPWLSAASAPPCILPPCNPGCSQVPLRALGTAWHSSQRSQGTRAALRQAGALAWMWASGPDESPSPPPQPALLGAPGLGLSWSPPGPSCSSGNPKISSSVMWTQPPDAGWPFYPAGRALLS